MALAPAVLLAFCVCACLLPLVKFASARWNLYDVPGELKIHRRPVSRVGGLAMMGAVVAVAVLSLPSQARGNWAPMLAIATVWGMGLADDLKSLSVLPRFAMQVGAAALMWVAGWRLHFTSYASVDCAATILFVVFLMNTLNWLDGMDGIAAANTAVAAAGFLLLPMGPFAGMLAAAMLGACAGMLLVNFPPASVFMGDSGSMLIGVMLAFLCLDWVRTNPAEHSIVSPLLFVAVPLADGILALARRLRMRRSPFLGDRRHFYDLLAERGWPVRRILCVSVIVTTVMVALGWAAQRLEVDSPAAIAGVIFLMIIAYLLGSLRPDRARQVAQDQAGPVHSIQPQSIPSE